MRRIDPAVVEIARWMAENGCLADGWDEIERLIRAALPRVQDDVLRPDHLDLHSAALRLPPDSPRYRLIWSRDGEVHRAQGPEPQRIALQSQPWDLLLHAHHDGTAPAVHLVQSCGRAEPLTNPPSPLLHARKAGAYVHVDKIDSVFTRLDARAVALAPIRSTAWPSKM